MPVIARVTRENNVRINQSLLLYPPTKLPTVWIQKKGFNQILLWAVRDLEHFNKTQDKDLTQNKIKNFTPRARNFQPRRSNEQLPRSACPQFMNIHLMQLPLAHSNQDLMLRDLMFPSRKTIRGWSWGRKFSRIKACWKNFKSEGLKWPNLRMNSIRSCLFVTLSVDKVPVKMLVDTGASVSIISENAIKRLNLDMSLI